MEPELSNPPKKHGCLKGCLVVACVAMLLAAGAVWLVLDPNSPMNKASAINCVCEWARLKPLPVPNSSVHVETKGSMFTREFIITFHADKETVLAWLNASPGTQNAYRDSRTLSHMHQEITPGGGAQFAEITISENGTKVVIRAYWS
jgi:hypothetical protein